MTGKRWAVAVAFCVLAAPDAFAQKTAPANAAPAATGLPSPSVAPAARTAQFPRLLPDKLAPETGQGAPLARQDAPHMITARLGTIKTAPAQQLCPPGDVGVFAVDEEIGVEKFTLD